MCKKLRCGSEPKMLPCIKISVEKILDAVSPMLKLGFSN